MVVHSAHPSMSEISKPYGDRIQEPVDPRSTTPLGQSILSPLPPALVQDSRHTAQNVAPSKSADVPLKSSSAPSPSASNSSPLAYDRQSASQRDSYVSYNGYDRPREKHERPDSFSHHEPRQEAYRSTVHFHEEDEMEIDYVQKNMLRITVGDRIPSGSGSRLPRHDRFIFREFAAPSL